MIGKAKELTEEGFQIDVFVGEVEMISVFTDRVAKGFFFHESCHS